MVDSNLSAVSLRPINSVDVNLWGTKSIPALAINGLTGYNLDPGTLPFDRLHNTI